MSIYSGFATRAQEECYDQAIDSLLYVLQRRIIKFYKNEEADEEKFISLVLKIHHQLRSMENNKYLEPKTSQSILELVKFMSIHQKNIGAQKSKTAEYDLGQPATHQTLPAVEQRGATEENRLKKKESLWVEKNADRRDRMIDQEMQTMGTIYEKKDGNSPKQSSVSRNTNTRQAVSALKTKYGQKINSKARHDELPPPSYGHSFKNRSQSHHLGSDETVGYQKQVRNHLKEIEMVHKKRRKSKFNQRLGIKDLNTEEDNSQYEVGDIIKQYVSRIKKKYETGDHFHRQQGEGVTRVNDF